MTNLTFDKFKALSLVWAGAGSTLLASTAWLPASDVRGARQPGAQAKADHADPEIAKLISDLGAADKNVREKAEKKLTDLGERVLPALYDAWEKGPATATAPVESLIEAIHKEHRLPTWVKGMEFKLIVEKEWLAGPFELGLEFKNTTSKVYRVMLPNVIIDLKDATGKKMVRYAFGGGGAKSRSSPPLERNETFTLKISGMLSDAEGGLRVFLRDRSTMVWNTIEPLAKAKYGLSVTYVMLKGKGPPADPPYWVGKAEMPTQTVVVK